MDEFIEIIINCLETRGIEGFIDEDCENIVYYNDDDEFVIFCKINETALTNKIEYHDMHEKKEIK